MQSSAQFSSFAFYRAAAPTALLGSTGRLSLAAAVLGMARSVEPARPGPLPGREASSPLTGASFDLAVQCYEDGRWADAFDAAIGQADAGDARAAKLALLMLRHGARLYGVGFSADPRRVARWATTVLQAAACTSSAPGRPMTVRGAPSPASTQRAPRSTSRRTASPSSITAIA